MRVIERVDGSTTSVGGFTWPVDERPRWLRFRTNGDRIGARLWQDGGSEPRVWTVETTDADVTGAGRLQLNLVDNGDGAPTHIDSITVATLDGA
jgi:hypothetical protein